MHWRTSKRTIDLSVPAVMGILNVTPDSFSDGGTYSDIESALRRADEMVAEGAAIIDVGGESTRPGSAQIGEDEETDRVVPVIEAIRRSIDVPVSIDTSRSAVAAAALDAGAEIINDISGLRFDSKMADVAGEGKAGLILMHSRGEFETLHAQPPVDDIFADVEADFLRAIEHARRVGVAEESIVLDVGIGFGKTLEQNLELIAKLDSIVAKFAEYPMLVGASRKSFIGRLLGDASPDERLAGSIAAAIIAAANGARVLRVHDVKQTVEALKVTNAILYHRK